ncbi:MAG: phospholipase D-like domain-containing protein [Opitutaceae bacterium]
MSDTLQRGNRFVSPVRALADQAFSRAAGAALTGGNRVRLLRDARENYPAWLEAIAAARHRVHFENYIFRDDTTGEIFADALIAAARSGVRVRLIYDWLGGFGKTSKSFWNQLRDGGVDIRCYNPPSLDAPFGWFSRDHRKLVVVDGEVGFITGLCIGRMWTGQPERKIEPWRDTGIEVRGPAVAEIERAFGQVWSMMGRSLPDEEVTASSAPFEPGGVNMRIVATFPSTAGMFRVDQLVAALARQRVWLTDAYFAGTTTYVQALNAAARDGVDVRLLVPGSTDIPIVRSLTRAGYRSLLEAGVRVFEWNGAMLHAKTAVADGRWARVGSTNLNLSSWLGNCELDAVIEDEPFACEMEAMYLDDLTNSTEIVLTAKRKLRVPRHPAEHPRGGRRGTGSASRAAAGALRMGNAIGAAFSNRRAMEPVEARLMMTAGFLLLALAALFAFFPRAFAYPAVLFFTWIALALLVRGYKLRRRR